MNIKGIEFLDEVFNVHKEEITINYKYPRLRSVLERVCKDLTSGERVQFPNLFARLNYVCDSTGLHRRKKYQINSFRINANKVLHTDFSPSEEIYLQDLKALCNAISHYYQVTIPTDLEAILPLVDLFQPNGRGRGRYPRIRIEVSSVEGNIIYGFDQDNATEEPIKIKTNVAGINDLFNDTVDKLKEHCQINLIDVTIDEAGFYIPEIIILEPDYLIDISSLAECMKEYGKNPLNVVQSKFEQIKNTKHILLGNVANHFLDEFVNENPTRPVAYGDAMGKAFKGMPFEFSTCEDINSDFFQDAQSQFENIRKTVQEIFPVINIDRGNGILEPSFICELLGVQGRLDFLQLGPENDRKFVIELKSGKSPFPEDALLIGLNHKTQASIYQIVIQKVLGVAFQNLTTYIFYSKYSNPNNNPDINLRNPYPSMGEIKEVLNIRNLIVSNEREIATDQTNTATRNIIGGISPATMITNRNANQNFLNRFIVPQINSFISHFNNSSNLELQYFHSFYSFVTKEHYLSKLQIRNTEEERDGSIWHNFESKKKEGDILYDLKITEIQAGTEEAPVSPVITLSIPEYENDALPNFRDGDLVSLYQRNTNSDYITNKQVFKGSIVKITDEEITIRIRFRQPNLSVLPRDSKYAVEHDYLDSAYNSMFRGLYSFLQANQDRKDLLLNQRQPEFDASITLTGDYAIQHGMVNEEINPIILKTKQAKDYFLLIGPPGTGKTSIALKSMVEEFLCEPQNNILLLSYTNRAVDEICDALNELSGTPSYIRIGSELSCHPDHRERLLERVVSDCTKRDEVKTRISEHRIFVGTVASVSGKMELFKLKTFQVGIIDEASQILEPSLLGILSAKNAGGQNAIKKFILIGDHKQLPAVVLQNEKETAIDDTVLNEIGLINRRNSLFERLFSLHRFNRNSNAWDMLHKHGRMHPEIALFPNYAFYNSKLEAVPRPHQEENLQYRAYETGSSIQKLIASSRIAFIPSEKFIEDRSSKTNTYEARMVKELVKNIYELYQTNSLDFSVNESIGVITTYRNQIALIKREIRSLNIPELNEISVDTVERYQGSQRDIIIYSFCINSYYQLDFLSNTMEEDGQLIDRKLNVAITRAKKQLFLIGNPGILSNNLIYYRLIEFIRSKSGYVNASPDKFINGDFVVESPDTDVEIGGIVYTPDEAFKNVFDQLVIEPLKQDERTPNNETWFKNILGRDTDFNRMNLIGYGRADFSQNQESLFGYTLTERVNLYCYYNMRKHYFSSLAIFKSFDDYFKIAIRNSNQRITFCDFGCGPLTSGLAFNQHFSSLSNFHFDYIGMDVSTAMLNKAREFSEFGLFHKNSRFQFITSLNEISENYWESQFTLSNTVILNYSYLFGNLSDQDAEAMAEFINTMMDNHPLNKYILVYQNSPIEDRNRTYLSFKKLVPRLKPVTTPRVETIAYRNYTMSNFDKTEKVYYEILSN